MIRTNLLIPAGLMCHAILMAQTPQVTAGYQSYQALQAGGRGGGGGTAIPVPRSETGKPFSATVTSQSVQVLGDGTRVSQTTTMLQYRDAEGRVRTETSRTAPGSTEQIKTITIRDPQANVSYVLDPAKRTAVKLGAVALTAAGAGGRGGRMGGVGTVAPQATGPEAGAQARGAQAGSGPVGGRGGGGGGRATVAGQVSGEVIALEERLLAVRTAIGVAAPAQGNSNDLMEDLGTLPINGVAAKGTRTTTVIPAGAIGNDREFRSVTERWFSPDLNLLIKSVSTDPRFGTTTYELTNISRLPPDLSLFQVPADYTVEGR